MKQPVFTGVCTAMVTPFLNNSVNYPMLEQLIHRQINSGISAIVLSGTTGESPTLTDSEKVEILKCARACAGKQCCIIAGTGTNSTVHAVRSSISAQQAGADALLVVSPYYNKGNPDGLYTHFLTIAQSVDIPIILYNVPSRTGVDVPVSVYQKLSMQPNIIGVKEASGDINKITKIRSCCPDDFYIWSGNDEQIVPVMSLGGKGVISVVSNLCPTETLAITDAALDGDFDTAAALQCQMLPLIELIFSEVNPIPIKYAMKCAGFDCGQCRLPLGMLSKSNQRKIENMFL